MHTSLYSVESRRTFFLLIEANLTVSVYTYSTLTLLLSLRTGPPHPTMFPSGGKAGQSDISTFLFLFKNREVRSLHDESLRCDRRPTRAKGVLDMEEILK